MGWARHPLFRGRKRRGGRRNSDEGAPVAGGGTRRPKTAGQRLPTRSSTLGGRSIPFVVLKERNPRGKWWQPGFSYQKKRTGGKFKELAFPPHPPILIPARSPLRVNPRIIAPVNDLILSGGEEALPPGSFCTNLIGTKATYVIEPLTEKKKYYLIMCRRNEVRACWRPAGRGLCRRTMQLSN